jgi:FkbM family methyltransferase
MLAEMAQRTEGYVIRGTKALARPVLHAAQRGVCGREAGFDKGRRQNEYDERQMRLLLSFCLSSSACCIDVGAHCGGFLSHVVRLAPEGQHIAYEPLPSYAHTLRSRFPTVDVRCAALSNTVGETTFIYVRDDPAYSGLRERTYPRAVSKETIVVHTERLDDDLPDGYAPHLIKIDVEGAELLVLQGAVETIRRHAPLLIFESGEGARNHYGFTARDVYALVCDDLGYRIFDLDGYGPYTLASFEKTDRFNFVAHR